MLRSYLICLSLLSFSVIIFGQSTIKGTVIDEVSGKPMSGVTVKTLYPSEDITDENGLFSVIHKSGDKVYILLEWNGVTREINHDQLATEGLNLGSLVFSGNEVITQDVELPSITLDDGEDHQEENISGLLQSGGDFFSIHTDYSFSPAKFRRRGLEAEYTEGFLNNLPINDLESGGIYYSNWGGLNDVMRQSDEVIGAEVAEWGFGGAAGTFNTDLRATSQWKQTRLSYAVTNRNYRNRITGTWSTGLRPSGWAVSLSGSRRWAEEGYVPGTFYDGWSYFASAGKKINKDHMLNFLAMASTYQRDESSNSIQKKS